MSNALSVLNKNANLPAHLRQAMQQEDHSWDNVGGMSIPRIEVSDRRIKAMLNGTVVAETKDPITVVLVKPGAVGRTFYAKEYTKGEKAKPDCYSIDGIKPAADAQAPQASRCDACEQNIKGSSKTMANAKACRYRQPVAVWIPGDKTWDTLFRVSLPATAIFPDEENSDGFRPLNKYVKELRAAGANPSMVYTSMAIDDFQDQPRLLFKPLGWIDDAVDFEQVRKLLDSPDVDDILNTMPQDDDTQTSGASNALGARPSHIDGDGVDTRRERRQAVERAPYPTAWPDAVQASDFVDDSDTYWYHEASDTYFMVKAGENLPDETGVEELQEAAFASDVAVQQQEIAAAEEKRRKEEEARRVEEEARRIAEEDARRKAAAAAAVDRASSPTRRRGAAAPAEDVAPAGRRRAAPPVDDAPAAPAGRRRAAPAETPEASDPAPTAPVSRRRQPVPQDDANPAPTAPAGRRTASPAQDAAPTAPVSRRRQPVPEGTGAADEGVAPPARRAAAAADEAPHARQDSNNLAALEDIILAENGDD